MNDDDDFVGGQKRDAVMKRSKEAIGCKTQKGTVVLCAGFYFFPFSFTYSFPACYQVDGHIWVGFDLCPDAARNDE